MKTLVIIPALDEAATIGEVVRRVHAAGYEAVVVDDGSTDATGEAARRAGAEVLRIPVNIGVGGALRTGFRHAVRIGATRVVQVDGDLQHDPASIPTLLAALDEGAELAIGSRFAAPGYRVGRARRWAMRVLSGIVSRRVGVALDDVTSGFRAIAEPLLSRFAADYPAEYLGDTVEAILLAHRHGARITQVPVTMGPRADGDATSSLAGAGHLLRIALVLLVRPRRRLNP